MGGEILDPKAGSEAIGDPTQMPRVARTVGLARTLGALTVPTS